MLRNFLVRDQRMHALRLRLINAGSAGQISSHEISDLFAGDAAVSWCPYNPIWSRGWSLIDDSKGCDVQTAVGKVATRLLGVGYDDSGVALA